MGIYRLAYPRRLAQGIEIWRSATNRRVEYPRERSLSTNNGTVNCGPIDGKSDQTGIYAAWMDVSL